MNELKKNDASGKMKHSLIIIIITSIIVSIAALGNAGLFEMKASGGVSGEDVLSGKKQTPVNFNTARVEQEIKSANNVLQEVTINNKINSGIEDNQSPVYKYGLVFMVTLVTGAFLFFLMLTMFFFRNLVNNLHAIISRISTKKSQEIPVSEQRNGEIQEMEDLIRLVDNIRSLMTEMTSAMVTIEDSNEDSDSVINIADTITFQTNLLALNAEIEAVRVDDNGYRFAAIADGVRQLAIRAADLAKDTNSLIKKKAKILQHDAAEHIIPGKMSLVDKTA